jgi:cytochrome b pre-mRNA-processing protein 3
VAAYDLALAAGEEPLAQALCKNILNGAEIEKAKVLARYAEAAIAVLSGLDEEALRGGLWRFPSPALSAAQP